MEAVDYLRILRRRWYVVALSALAVLGLSLVYTGLAVPQYRSSVQFFISTPTGAKDAGNAYNNSLFSQERVKSYAAVVSSRSLADAVAGSLNLPPRAVEGHITAQTEPGTVLLDLSVADSSPRRAADIAEAAAAVVPRTVQALERPLDGGLAAVRVSVVEPPQVPTRPFSPRPARSLGLGLALGLILGLGLALLRESLDNAVNTSDDVLNATGTSTLGAIVYDPSARKHPLVNPSGPHSARLEAFRQLRTNLQFVDIDRPLRSLTLTSAVPKEGKSTTACNLAVTLAAAGISVVLVEGDLRRPMIAQYMGLEKAVGVTDVLVGNVELAAALQRWGRDGLQVLASGPLPPNPAELLSSGAMRELIRRLEEEFDVVIVDAPPLLPITDAAILASITSGALLTVRCRSTKREQLRRAAEALQAVDATVLGAVLNMVPRRGLNSDDTYSYAYRYTRPEREVPARAAVAARPDAPPGDVPPRPAPAPPTWATESVPRRAEVRGPQASRDWPHETG